MLLTLRLPFQAHSPVPLCRGLWRPKGWVMVAGAANRQHSHEFKERGDKSKGVWPPSGPAVLWFGDGSALWSR